jgi:hypothetical protein
MSVSPTIARLIDFDRNPGEATLRVFGLAPPTFGIALGTVLMFWGFGWIALAVLGGIGLTVAAAYYSIPAIRRPIYTGWMTATLPMSWLISHVLLAAVYYLVLTPIGLVMRVVGRDPLQRSIERDAGTYWVEREGRAGAERYFRQF